MEELIKQIASQVSIPNDTAKNALSGILGFTKSNVTGDLFSKIAAVIPGADELVSNAAANESTGGGLLGNLAKQAASAIGGNLGGAIGLASVFSKLNLDTSQAGSIISTFAGFLKEKGGDSLFDQLKAELPDISKFLS